MNWNATTGNASLSQQMVAAARRASTLLDDVTDLVEDFLRSQLAPEGGFRNRSGEPDLYYTMFGLEAMRALDLRVPENSLRPYLERFAGGQDLDLVHVSCLVRCWASAGITGLSEDHRRQLIARVIQHRSRDGGFSTEPGRERGSVYAAFLAVGSCQDLGTTLPSPDAVVATLHNLRLDDGSSANEPGTPIGTTPVTAAAVVLDVALDQPADPEALRWLLAARHPDGGFLAHPLAPAPDLLSTATALHALSMAGTDLSDIREECLDFIDRLWSSRGGFRGTEDDNVLDCEYCWYGLLALGHLAGQDEPPR
jgi:prenyltransferase beta subunit